MKHRINKNQTGFLTLITALLAGITVLPGCMDSYAPTIVTPLETRVEIIGQSVKGRPIECFRFGTGTETILIFAAIHGNETAGVPLVYKLIEHIQKDRRLLRNRTILIIPVANPDGLAIHIRENANEVDLNRNFPTANRINISEYGTSALSEPEAIILKEVVQTNHPDIVVSIHQPLSCIDYDGPAQQLAENMARICDLPVKKLGGRPGSMGSFVGDTLGIPIITMELRAKDSNLSANELWARYGRALIAAILYPEIHY